LGAALLGWHHFHDKPRTVSPDHDTQRGSFLGPAYDTESFAQRENLTATELSDDQIENRVAALLEEGKVIGWFQDRMEFGPRALGNRSILGDPRRSDMQEKLNLKIKFRESFRPFAPAIMEDRVSDCFDLTEPSAYMLLVAPVREALRTNSEHQPPSGILGKLKHRRSALPAITHVDYSARVQTVSATTNPRFYKLLAAFERRTGCPVLVNTSFNVRGEPPVCTPEDAYRCFLRTEMDYLVLGNLLIDKDSRSGGLQTADLKPTAVWKAPFLDLRRFGLTTGSAFLVLGAIFIFRHRPVGWPLASIGAFLLLFAVFTPSLLRFIYRPWMRLAGFLGSISSRILLTLLFFLVLTPIGFLQRRFGRQPIDLRFKTNDATYWQKRTASPALPDYEKQF